MKTQNLITLQKCLICEMSKITKNYQSDFIIDINTMNALNEKGALIGKGYAMFRENGTEFSLDKNNVRLTYFKKEYPNSVIYEIDFDKLSEMDVTGLHYTGLLISQTRFEDKFRCINIVD